MVVQFISSVKYVYESRFVLPQRTGNDVIGYEIFRDEGIVKCFCCDEKDVRGCDLNRWIVPEKAREMEFSKMDFHGDYRVGWPIFYDRGGNLLKMGSH